MASTRSCSFYGCNNSSTKNQKYQMFEIPLAGLPGSQQEERCKEWIQRTCNPALMELSPHEIVQRKRCVCADHFEPHQFQDERRNRLKRNQIPKWNATHGTPGDRCHAAGPELNAGQTDGCGLQFDTYTTSSFNGLHECWNRLSMIASVVRFSC